MPDAYACLSCYFFITFGTICSKARGVMKSQSMKEVSLERLLLQKLEDEEDVRDADKAMEHIKKGESTLSHQELKHELKL